MKRTRSRLDEQEPADDFDYLTTGVPQEIRGLILWHLGDRFVSVTMGEGFYMPHDNRIAWLRNIIGPTEGDAIRLELYKEFVSFLHAHETYEYQWMKLGGGLYERRSAILSTTLRAMMVSLSRSLRTFYILAQTCRCFHDAIHGMMDSLWSWYGRISVLIFKISREEHLYESNVYGLRLREKVSLMSSRIAVALGDRTISGIDLSNTESSVTDPRLRSRIANVSLRYMWHCQWSRIVMEKVQLRFKRKPLSGKTIQGRLESVHHRFYLRQLPWRHCERLSFAPAPGPEPVHARFVEVDLANNTVSHLFTNLRKDPGTTTFDFGPDQTHHVVMEVNLGNGKAIAPTKVTIEKVREEWSRQKLELRKFIRLHRRLLHLLKNK